LIYLVHNRDLIH